MCFFRLTNNLLFLGSTGNGRLEKNNRIKMEILDFHVW